ncbi:MAG: membrane protein insertase YidC, partial [Rikenellaceae bacterium]
MDKNKITAFLLILLIFVGYAWFSSSDRQEVASAGSGVQNEVVKTEADTTAEELTVLTAEERIANDSIAKAAAEARAISAYGEMLYSAQNKQKEEYTLQNDKVKIGISTLGATINSVELKDYKTWDDKPLYLFNEESALFDLKYRTAVDVNTSKYVFTSTSSQKDVTVTGDSASLSFRLYNDSTAYVEYIYTLAAEAYQVDLRVNFVNMDYIVDRGQKNMTLNWAMDALQTEKGFDYENQNTNLSYKLTAEDGIDELSMGTSDKQAIAGQIQWVAYKKQFFSSILRYNASFDGGELSYQNLPASSGELKHFDAVLNVPFSADKSSYDFSFYFAPNSYDLFQEYGDKIEKLVPLGWGILGWINRFLVIPVFNFLSNYISNYGWIILFLTIIIKLIIFPFTYKSYVSMAKMRIIKPEVDALNQKYPNKDQ